MKSHVAPSTQPPSWRRRLWRVLLATLVLPLLAGAFYLLAALFFTLWPANRGVLPVQEGVEIFLVSNGVHVDLVVPVRADDGDWRTFLSAARFDGTVAEPAHLAFGWGERRFFLETPTWADLEPSVAVTATLWPTAAALRVTWLPGPPRPGPKVRRTRVTEEAFKRLLRHIRSGFELDTGGRPIHIASIPKRARGSVFFEGAGTYHAFRTCNSWSNEGLKIAGLRTATWAPFEASILRHFEPEP